MKFLDNKFARIILLTQNVTAFPPSGASKIYADMFGTGVHSQKEHYASRSEGAEHFALPKQKSCKDRRFWHFESADFQKQSEYSRWFS